MSTGPIVVEQHIAPPDATQLLSVPADLEYFAGHFPGAPVVPGVVQLKWAIEAAQRHLGVSGAVVRMEALKFQQVMLPGTFATLTLKWVATDGKLYFSYQHEAARFSSGRLWFQPAREDAPRR